MNNNEKFCTRCGKKFVATGREVICPSCKQAAAEESKKAAVLRAKRASWCGESVPVRISGRASTIIRRYGKVNNLSFAAALDDLIKSSDYFKGIGIKWDEVEPYKSHRRDRNTTEDTQDATETAQDKPQDKPIKQAAKTAVKKAASKPTSTAKKAASEAIKTTAKKAVK